MEHEFYMRQALALASEAAERGEVPVGAVVTDENGVVIGRGSNRCEGSRSATRHAEIEAIEQAGQAKGGWRLERCTLYVTLEPCPMCAGAVINARIGTVVYGAKEPVSGSCGSILDLFSERYSSHPAVYGGVLQDECAALLRSFFLHRRDILHG